MSSYYNSQNREIPTWDSFDAGDDDDVVDTSEYAYASRDHILFCIDASRSMQTPFPDQSNPQGLVRGKSALHQVLDSVVELYRRKVITGPADSVGVLFWNVDPDKTPPTPHANYKPGTYVYQPLRMINAEEIKKINRLRDTAREEHEVQDQDEDVDTVQPDILAESFPAIGKGDELNIADVLVTCNFLFRDAGTKLAGNKRVFLVTDNDEPPGSSSNRAPARTVYGDLLTYGVTINTFFIDRPKHRFDSNIFWNDILGREPDDDKSAEVEPEGLEALADTMNDLVIKHAPKRIQFTVPLRFGGKDGDIEIGISGYALVSAQGKGQPKYVRMRGQTVEEVQTKTEYTSAETGAVLRDEEIGQAYQFGNESTVRNVLEPNWWETDMAQEEARIVADEVLRLDTERRMKEDENGEDGEDEKMDGKDNGVEDAKPGNGTKGSHEAANDGKQASRVVARTRLQFTSDEVAEFKSMGITPQIKILGFQSPNNLSYDENIKHSYFIYPSETTYTGSTRTFAALLKSCHKLKRHALALCRLRTNTPPEFAVLIPQQETFTPEGTQDAPPGFHVVVLPYKDDIRQPPRGMTDNLTATEQQAKVMSNIVKRMKIKKGYYRSEVYPNPALAYHYAQLQSLAFEEDFDLQAQIDEIDKTFPKHHGMHRIAGAQMAEWNRLIEEDDRAVEYSKPAAKRGVSIDPDTLPDVVGAYRAGTIDKLKVADLRNYAKCNNISLSGKSKKTDIIDGLKEHLDKESGGKRSKKG